jgi:hypothetical protein
LSFKEYFVTPTLAVVSDNDAFLRSLVASIASVECSNFFSAHIGKSQTDQKLLVSGFQAIAAAALSNAIEEVQWSVEHCPSPTNRDSIDIFGRGAGFVVVIELDKNRADQVANKFVSRMALLPSTKVYFVSLCYPGTERMNKAECTKYFGYCSALALRMGCHYAGFIVE